MFKNILKELDSVLEIDEPVFREGTLSTKIDSLQNYLGNKKVMYDILSNDPRSFKFLPLTITFNVSVDTNYKNIILNVMKDYGIKTWILKPALGLQGKDIFISNKPDKVIEYIQKKSQYSEWVLSQYIDNPFLLKIKGKSSSGAVFNDTIGRKVHIRIYVLLTLIDNVPHIYLYKDNLIFSAVCEYRKRNLRYRYSNLTNLHLGSIYYNKKLNIDGSLAYKDLSSPLKETLAEVFGPKFYNQVVFPQIKNMLIVILENSKKYLKYEKIHQHTRGTFHRMAIDIMPDDNFKLYLLEINAHAGMNAPEYHWNGLRRYAKSLLNKTSDFINNKKIKNDGFLLIK
jgi:hypothetical protein